MADRNTMNCEAIERQDDAAVARSNDAHRKSGAVTFRPPLDLFDLGDRYEIHVDLPGSNADRINVTVHEGVLTIEATVPQRLPEEWGGTLEPLHGEYGIGDFRRQIRLGEDIEADALGATYADGVLHLVLPKRAERQPRRIDIKTA